MEKNHEEQNKEKSLKRSGTLPIYTYLMLSNPKSKYKQKKLFHCNSLQKKNENSVNSGLTRVNTLNYSNTQLIQVSGKKPKGRVNFAPKYRLVDYINYNPTESIYKKDNKSEEIIKNENNTKKKEIENKTNCNCACILF